MFPVGVGQSLILKETIQFNAINKAVFLNKSQRYKSDPQYGEIIRQFRVGLATKEDIQMIITRFIKTDNIVLPTIPTLRCACFSNDEKCTYNSSVFLKHLEATHTKTNDDTLE